MRKIISTALAMLTTLGVVLALTFGSAVGPAKAAATSTSPLLLGLNGVSCGSARFCAAVGAQGDSARPARGDVPLTMIWNGARWRKTAAPLPQGWPEGQLNSVSCPSAAYCVAVGYVVRVNGYSPFAETWHGRAWTASTLPKPTTAAVGAVEFGGSVSCGAVGRCVALVGYRGAETLAGGKWTLRAVPLPKGSDAGSFAAVSCVAATSCALAGVRGDAKGGAVLFEWWNGRRFTPMKVSSGPTARPFTVTGVSCTSVGSCAAVGQVSESPGYSVRPFAERWNGRAWSLTTVTGPRNANPEGVSCASAARCVAVGVTSGNGSEQTSHALALAYDGRSCTTARVPALPHGGTSAFQAVSCPSAKNCVAVGEGGGPGGTLYSNAALTAFWNGKSWKLVAAS
jgi:hypothetical protein